MLLLDDADHPDATGVLVTADGIPLSDGITIPQDAEDITIGTDGTVSVTQNGISSPIGNIQLYRFPNAAGLSSEGSNLYAATTASGTPLEYTWSSR